MKSTFPDRALRGSGDRERRRGLVPPAFVTVTLYAPDGNGRVAQSAFGGHCSEPTLPRTANEIVFKSVELRFGMATVDPFGIVICTVLLTAAKPEPLIVTCVPTVAGDGTKRRNQRIPLSMRQIRRTAGGVGSAI